MRNLEYTLEGVADQIEDRVELPRRDFVWNAFGKVVFGVGLDVWGRGYARTVRQDRSPGVDSRDKEQFGEVVSILGRSLIINATRPYLIGLSRKPTVEPLDKDEGFVGL